MIALLMLAAPLPLADLEKLQAVIRPAKGEDAWAGIPWRTDLWEARKVAAKTQIKTYVCPSTPVSPDRADPLGYGAWDYMFIAASDIEDGLTAGADSPVGERPFSSARRAQQGLPGMLTCGATGRAIVAVTDGISNTILCIEDAGRAHPNAGVFASYSSRPTPIAGDPVRWSGGATGGRRMYAWADPDAGANGLSGPSNSTGSPAITATSPIRTSSRASSPSLAPMSMCMSVSLAALLRSSSLSRWIGFLPTTPAIVPARVATSTRCPIRIGGSQPPTPAKRRNPESSMWVTIRPISSMCPTIASDRPAEVPATRAVELPITSPCTSSVKPRHASRNTDAGVAS